METRDLDRIHFVTHHFHDLQGLRNWVPLGLITLSGGCLLVLARGPWLLLPVLLALAAFLVGFRARRHYSDTFGEVEQPQLDPLADLVPLSVFSPAGPTPRLGGVQQVSPMARLFLATAVLTMVLFSIFQATPPRILVQGQESLGQHPRIVLQPSGALERPWIIGSRSAQPAGIFEPPWVAWVYSKIPTRPPSALRAVFGQMMYALYGAIFLSVWFWRERRSSQSHHLALGVLLLGLSALGTSLGFYVREDGEVSRMLDVLLPVLVYPGVALLLCGASMILAGVLDHRQLVRALGNPRLRMGPGSC